MRTANNSEMDRIPPPPYTEVADASDAASQPVQASLRGGYMRPSLPSEMPSDENNLSSAITYFEDPDDPDLHRAGVYLSLAEYTITFNRETTRDDLAYPLPIETYIARDVTSLDWSTFVNFLFPMRDEVRHGKLRPEKDPQRHSFIEEDTPARRDRILAVIAEWNENFFNPRRIHIKAGFSPLPSYPSSRSTAIPSVAQGPYVESRPLQPAQPTMYRDAPAQWSANLSTPQPIHRSLSTSSSDSSSSSSMDSVKSKDLEGVDLGQIRSALLAFQLDATKKDHLHASVRQLRDGFRSQRRNLSGKDSKELKKEYRNQRKEIKKEVKAVVKEVKATRKADRKVRKAERKSQREGKRAERGGNDRIKDSEDTGRRAEERAAEKVRHAQERGREAEGRASEKAARAHGRAREAQAQEATAVARAQERVADARARGWDGEAAATQRAQEIKARTGAAQRRARETAGRDRYEINGGQETGVLLTED
ncbi:hypothetical protein HO133_010692 [Letharia lupina]|uniref:Uncharacterized protein n=1 Tax=Letharia lupina TaxID=560253 RepID=A0A8H6FDR9_9LECA|nr:uncharacterized protein HO133_010692 [Letharia lupina]KAF6224118.1 hypothetical protein HO133_010692 [Letharia lupina]